MEMEHIFTFPHIITKGPGIQDIILSMTGSFTPVRFSFWQIEDLEVIVTMVKKWDFLSEEISFEGFVQRPNNGRDLVVGYYITKWHHSLKDFKGYMTYTSLNGRTI
jgi:hypothetical protein